MSVAVAPHQLQQLQSELVDYQRQALLGAVAGMMAHEFNNIMTPVLFRTQDALLRDDAAAMRKAVECTLQQTERAIAIARRLLEFAQGQETEPRAYPVAEAVENALTALARPLAKDGIELRTHIESGLTVLAEPVLIDQVLLNLLLNAREATRPRRGTVTITAVRDNGFVQFDVADTGRGISPERLETVIRPFLASDPDVQPCDWKRVGLGLNVCRTIAARHGAQLDALPNPAGGCVFRLRWPAAEA